MQALTPAELLALWEAGRPLDPLDRGTLAARAAFPGSENPADWPIGRRNWALALLHCAMFGGVLRGWTRCGACGEQLEFAFDGRSVADAKPAPDERGLVNWGTWRFRLPTSRDLAAAAQEQSEPAATRRLMRACLVGGEPAEDLWNDEDVRAIEERLAEADPLAEIRLHFDCPACSASFDESLDLGRFVWATIDSRAKRILREVHVLASTYGWSEGQILALSPSRRSAYLQIVLGWSGYLGRLLQAAAHSEQRLHPIAGSIYSGPAAETEPSFELGEPHWAALDQPESEQAPASPIAKTEVPELTTPFEQRAAPQPRLDPREFGSASATRPADPIRTATATGEPPGPARTMRDRDATDTSAAKIHGRLRLQNARSETRADDVTGRRSVAVAMDQDNALIPDALMVRQAAPPVATALKIRQSTRDQNFASKLRAEEPEVQVHIGRVEVLAVQPPAPAAPAPRRETATRLADYLAARNGSSR